MSLVGNKQPIRVFPKPSEQVKSAPARHFDVSQDQVREAVLLSGVTLSGLLLATLQLANGFVPVGTNAKGGDKCRVSVKNV